MTKVIVTCCKCKSKFTYDEPSKLHLSHKDRHMVCADCENYKYRIKATEVEDD